MLNWNEALSKDAYEFTIKDVDSEISPEYARNLRLKLRLSQKMFAKILGISEKTIEKWEQGKNPIKGTSSRMLFLLSKHEELLDDLYLVKREDEEFFYQGSYVVRAVRKPKNVDVTNEKILYKPTNHIGKGVLTIKSTNADKNPFDFYNSI